MKKAIKWLISLFKTKPYEMTKIEKYNYLKANGFPTGNLLNEIMGHE